MQVSLTNTTYPLLPTANSNNLMAVSKVSVSKMPMSTVYTSQQQGFTLVELMISLVLGLLISAAAVQIYLTNARTSTVQKSGSELQDASVFGIQQLESHLRLANLGNSVSNINDTTEKGGIVLTGSNIVNPAYTTPAYFTHSAGDTAGAGANGWTGISNTTIASDQLTIQFQNITNTVMSDCEGTDIAINDTVIERYFLRNSTGTNGIVMACDAGRVVGGTTLNFGGAGQEFISNVDQFKVQFVTQNATGLQAYMSPHDYMSLPTAPKPSITGVKVGLIVRGSTATVSTEGQSSFTLLGQPNALKSDVNTKFLRNTYESTTLLRNARPTN